MKREAFHHPKMLDLASRLAVSRTHACGIVGNLWNWAADVAPQGNIGKWPDGAIALACDWPGEASAFVEALACSGWLDRCSEYRLVIHDLEDHCPEWLKTKLKRTGKVFIKAAPPTQVPGASARTNTPGSAPLCSSLLCSTQQTSSKNPTPTTAPPRNAPAESASEGRGSGFYPLDSIVTEQTLADPDALDRYIDHDAMRSDTITETSEAFRPNAHAAAAKARTAHGIRDRVGFFKWMIKGRHWKYLRIADEEVAATLRRDRSRAKGSDRSLLESFLKATELPQGVAI